MEVKSLEVEEELSMMPTLFWAEGVRMNSWRREEQKAWEEAIFF